MSTILQKPELIELVGNLPEIIVSSVDDVNIKLLDGGITVLDEIYSPGEGDLVQVQLMKLVRQMLTVQVPTSNVFEQTGGAKTFTLDIDGAQSTHTIVAGGVNAAIDAVTFLKANWLTWQLQQKRVKYTDPEWLSYYAAEAVNVKLKAYFKDAVPEIITLTSLAAGKLYSLNVQFLYLSGLFTGQPVYFDIWTEDATAVQLSFVQRYVLMNDYYEHDNLFVFANSLGGLDTARFTGQLGEENQFDIQSAILDEDNSLDFDVDYDQVYKKNTGYFSTLREKAWVEEFFKSAQRYYLDEGTLKPIIVQEPEAKIEHGDISTYSYEFTFALGTQTRYLNLPRVDELPETVEIIDPESELFFLAPRLVDFPAATLDDSLLFLVQTPFLQEWKQTTFGAIKDYIIQLVAALGYITGDGVTWGNLINRPAWTDYFEIVNPCEATEYIRAKTNLAADGEITAYAQDPYTPPTIWDAMPTASATVKGGVKIGDGLTIDANGVLSANVTSPGVTSWNDLTDRPAWLTYSTLATFEAGHGHAFSQITGKPTTLAGYGITDAATATHNHTGVYEPVFSKNTAFNKNFGTTAGTVAEGNDSRMVNGQTAYSWGNHASAGYLLSSTASSTYMPIAGGTFTGTVDLGNSSSSTLPNHYYHRLYTGSIVYTHFYPNGGNGTTITKSNQRVWNGAGGYKTLEFTGDGIFRWNNYNVFHSGNANLTTVNWSAQNLTLAGSITGATSITATGAVSTRSKYELRNSTGTLKWAFELSGDDLVLKNAAGTITHKFTQAGDIQAKAEITAYATL